MPQTKIAEPMSLVHNWLEEFRRDKRASRKAGADATAGGDNTDDTTHPVMDADPQTAAATEGAHAQELTSDVKDQVGGDPITGQTDSGAADASQPSDEMGTKKMDASEVKGNIQKPEDTKDALGGGPHTDGDASPQHPTTAALKDQEKYSELRKSAAAILQAFASAGVKQADAPAKRAAVTAPASASTGDAVSEEAKEAALKNYPNDFDNGFVAASVILQQMGMAKQAEATVDSLVDEQIASTVATARQDADDAIDYLAGFEKGAALKQAAGGMPLPPELMGGAPGMGGAPEMGGGDPALEGGAPGAEGIPPEVAQEAAAEGEPPAEEMGEQGGGEGGNEEDAIIQALAEAGVTPEELEAALAESGAGEGGGGAEGGMGGEPSPEAMKAAESINRKVAKLVNKRRLQALLRD